MGKFIDMTGQKFGKLQCVEYMGGSKWKCLCDCGNTTIVNRMGLVKNKTKSCGCLKRKYNINENYFDNIDSEEKAYILGLICVDGNLTLKPNNVKIDLLETDIDILNKVLKAMNYNYVLRHYHQKGKFSDNDKIYEIDLCRLNITNTVIVKKLFSYGIIPNKSKKLDFNMNVIPKKYYKDFIRGMWDGNGYVGYKHQTINFTSSYIMIDKIKKILEDNCPDLKCYVYTRHKDVPEIKTLIANNKNGLMILDYLYKDAKIYLDRKYENYKKYITY